MKIQIDSNNYLTGNYCMVGDLDNSVEMSSLPDGEPVYYPAYKILSIEVEHTEIVNQEVAKQRELTVPILDEEGNDTGETQTIIEDYTETVPTEVIITTIEYYYEFDSAKKETIDYAIAHPVIPVDPITEINDKIKSMQSTLVSVYEYLL